MNYFKTFEQMYGIIQGVYHCTDSEFDAFDNTYITNLKGDLYGKGFYFTDNLEYAKQFGSNIYVCDIQLYQPIDLTKGAAVLLELSHDIPNERIATLIRSGAYTSAYRLIRDYKSEEELKALGYDGVIGYCEFGGKEYLIFDSQQVKIKGRS
jgi:hypothetical protein